jgi:hypothetical protein
MYSDATELRQEVIGMVLEYMHGKDLDQQQAFLSPSTIPYKS